jgi:nucleoid-associated protein Lsr2
VLLFRALRAGIGCAARVFSGVLAQQAAGVADAPAGQPEKVVPLAQKMLVVVVDDVSGETLAEDGGQTVSFGLDGQAYEIDLSDENAAQLRRAVQRYVDAGRRVGRQSAPRGSGRSARGARGGRGSGRGQDTAAIREWARAHGLPVSDRGRIPAKVLEAYAAG